MSTAGEQESEQGPGSPGASNRLPREVWVLAAAGFLIAVGFGVMSPVLPVYARTFGVQSFLIGLVVSALAVVRLVTLPLSSWLLRFVGPRELAITGQILIAVTTFMIGLSDSYSGILVWRGLSGFGSALYMVSSLALLFAATPPHQRGRANALSGGGFVLGGIAGPALGGLIAGVSITAPFYFYAVTLGVSALVMALLLPRTPAADRRQLRQDTVSLLDLLRDRRYRAVICITFASGWQSHGVRIMVVPLFVVEVLRQSTAWTGIAFTVAAVAQASCLSLTGWATDHWGRRPMLLAGGAVTAVISLGLAWAQSYWLMVVLLCLYSVAASATGAATQALLADTVPRSAGTGLAVYQMAGDVGMILGPLVAGAILDLAPMPWAWLPGIALIGLGLVLAWRLPDGIQPPVGG